MLTLVVGGARLKYTCLHLGGRCLIERTISVKISKEVRAVSPKGSSSTRLMCGFKLSKYLNGRVECKSCSYFGDRHVTACLNLLKPSDVRLRFSLERPSNVVMTPALTTA